MSFEEQLKIAKEVIKSGVLVLNEGIESTRSLLDKMEKVRSHSLMAIREIDKRLEDNK